MTSFQRHLRRVTLFLIVGLLGVFTISLYLSLSLILQRHLDHQVLQVAQTEARHLEEESGHLPASLDSPHSDDDDHPQEDDFTDYDRHELQESIRHSVLVDPEGSIVWKGESVHMDLPISESLRRQALNGTPAFDSVQLPNGTMVRRILYPVAFHGSVRFLLQTYVPSDWIEDTRTWLAVMLGGISVLVLGIGWWGSHWVARQALLPIQTLSTTAEQITEKSLGTRLSLVAPYEEFRQLTQSFNAMLDRLQQIVEAQRRFVGDAAHELKTPLTAIKGNLEVALQKPRSPEAYHDTLAAIHGQIERLIQLSKSLLTLAQFSGDHPPVSLHPLDLGRLLRELAQELTILIEEKGGTLRLDIEKVPPVLGDEGLLKQLIVNLLDNAIRYTPQGGTVTLALQQAGAREVTFSVEDSGPGIGADHLPHLFERFYRVDPGRDRKSGGAGLGLSIVKEIVVAHHGRIQVWSEPGRGTRFTITLPLAPEPTSSP